MTIRMLVPKAPMDEDDFMPPRKHQVRRPWQRPDMQSVAETEAVSDPTDDYFGRRIPAPHLRHIG